MRVYLDVCCLNRPYDSQLQLRVRIESEAVLWVLGQIEQGRWTHVSSIMVTAELAAMQDGERRQRILALLPPSADIMAVTHEMSSRAAEVRKLGFSVPDAVHVAAAEAQKADVLLTCDDRFLRVAHRHRQALRVRVADPVNWAKECEHEPDT